MSAICTPHHAGACYLCMRPSSFARVARAADARPRREWWNRNLGSGKRARGRASQRGDRRFVDREQPVEKEKSDGRERTSRGGGVGASRGRDPSKCV
ncbi:hypothetical protein NL676_024111 [Syzygium grande]|nr:hypothetical protein NL676_024111 [Syzygium grande]